MLAVCCQSCDPVLFLHLQRIQTVVLCVCVCVCVCVWRPKRFSQYVDKGFCAQVESAKIWDIYFYPLSYHLGCL